MTTYYFKKEEIETMGKELAELEIKKARTEEDKKLSAASFKAEIDAMEERIAELSQNINNGFEQREETLFNNVTQINKAI